MVGLAELSRDILNACTLTFFFFSIPCRFVFTSALFENGIAVFRRRQDNTLEASQVLNLFLKRLKSNVLDLSITELFLARERN